jgi:putative glutamine amidotransferase
MWWFYWFMLRSLGACPVRMLPVDDPAFAAEADGLVIGGGDDIGAEIYHGRPMPDVRIDPRRDQLELRALEYAVRRDIPVLGICRGAQMLNVFFGGTLYQDVYEAYEGLRRRWTPLPVKDVDIVPDSRLARILRRDRVRVNSLHSQSVDRLGQGLAVTARDEAGVVQAIEAPGAYFRIGVQWHPEFMIYRAPQRRLFRSFVDAIDEATEAGGSGR